MIMNNKLQVIEKMLSVSMGKRGTGGGDSA